MSYWNWDEYSKEYGLPAFNITKTRSQPNPRTETDVFSGPLRVELRMSPDEVPVTWDCSIICRNQYETSMVGAFFHKINVEDSMLFYKNLPTEYGMYQHFVRVTGGIPQPDAGTTGRNEMMKYSFTIYAEQVEKPQFIIDDPLTYIMYAKYASIIDIAVNSLAPEAD